MGLINFLKGVDIDKQRKQLFIDPFDKGSKTIVYNIGRNGSATILKVEDPKNVMLEKGTKTYTANGITYDIPTLEKKNLVILLIILLFLFLMILLLEILIKLLL